LANFQNLRDDLATALAGAGRVSFAYPKENPTAPALVLVPSSPYVRPQSIGGLNNRIAVRLDLTAMVYVADNQAALANLETLMLAVFDVLPAGISVDAWTQPIIEDVANTKMLTSQLTLELVTTNNGN
jgi:hypothetical protein